MNSNLDDLRVGNTSSNTRAAAMVAQGQSPEKVSRPSKFRSSIEEYPARLPRTFQSQLPKIHIPSIGPEMEKLTSSSPPTSPVFNTSTDRDFTMLLQPETRPITQEQLVNEVKGIYAGLVMVEKKCVEVYSPPALVLCIAYRYFLCRLTNNRAPPLTSYRMNSGKL